MTSERVYADYLRDMIEYAEAAEGFLQGMSFEEFQSDQRSIFAVIRALEVIGEAAAHIPPGIRRKYPAVPWRRITGLRNVAIHGCFRVNLWVIFSTVKEQLSELREAVGRALDDLEQEERRG